MSSTVGRSARAMLREWVEQETDGLHDIAVDDLRAKATRYFMNNKEFTQALLDSALQELLAPAIRETESSRRSAIKRMIRDISPDRMHAMVTNRISRGHWKEMSEEGRHVSITDMRREDLLYAGEQHAVQERGHARSRIMCEDLASQLSNDNQYVYQKLSDEQVADIVIRNHSPE